ncbi:uncharacterized protein LOC127879794 isoform X2 [Dreissena polymorpha]|uniref:uncharacterized protein LOC127879794 isoform X2 n=1 Tax=Dreissena polymorpha TaxID=45954 RepID=UPI002265375E|nr:uncharacterized protein LOC127879794 isoform X2 [Dreissena polymorpha]
MNEHTKALFIGAFELEDTRATRASVLPWEKAEKKRISSGHSTQIEGKESCFNSQKSTISGSDLKTAVPHWLRDTQQKSHIFDKSQGALDLEDTRKIKTSVLPWEETNTEHLSSGRAVQISIMEDGKESRFDAQKSTASGLDSKTGVPNWLRDTQRKDSSAFKRFHGASELEYNGTPVLPWEMTNTERISSGRSKQKSLMEQEHKSDLNSQKSSIYGLESKTDVPERLRDTQRKDSSNFNKSHGAFKLEENRTTRSSVLPWEMTDTEGVSSFRSMQKSLVGEGHESRLNSQKSAISGLEPETDVPEWLRDTQRKESSVNNKSHGFQRKSQDKALAREDLGDMSWLETAAKPQRSPVDERVVLRAFELDDTRTKRASVLPWEKADTERVSSGRSTNRSLMSEGQEARFNSQKSTISGLEPNAGVPDWLGDTQQKDFSVSNKSLGTSASPGEQNWIQKARESPNTVLCSTITKNHVISDDIDWLMKARASLNEPASPATARSCRLDDDYELADDFEEIMTQMRKDFEETHSPGLAIVLQNIKKDMHSHGDTVANDEQLRKDAIQTNYVITQRKDDDKSNQPMTTLNESYKYYFDKKHEPYEAGQTVSDAHTESSISLKHDGSDDDFWGSKSESKSRACDNHAHAIVETKDKQESHSENDNAESYSLRLPNSSEDSDQEGKIVTSVTLNDLETLPDQCSKTMKIETNVSAGSADLPNHVQCPIGNDTFTCLTLGLGVPVSPNLNVPKITVIGACNKETKLAMVQDQRLQYSRDEMDSETTSETRDANDDFQPKGNSTDYCHCLDVNSRYRVEFSKFKNADNCTNDDCATLPPKYNLKDKDNANKTRLAQIENEVRFLKQTSIIQSQEVRILALERILQEHEKKLNTKKHEFQRITFATHNMESFEIDNQIGQNATVLNRIEYANKPNIVSESDETIHQSAQNEIDATKSTKPQIMKQKTYAALSQTLADQSMNTDVSGTKYYRDQNLQSKCKRCLEYVSDTLNEPRSLPTRSTIDFKGRRNEDVYLADTNTQQDVNSSSTKKQRRDNTKTHNKRHREMHRQENQPVKECHDTSSFSDLGQIKDSDYLQASVEPRKHGSYPDELEPSINVQNNKNVINIFCFPRKQCNSGKKHENEDLFSKNKKSEKKKSRLINTAMNFVANLKSRLFSCRQDVGVSNDEVTNNERLLKIVSSHDSPTPSIIVIEKKNTRAEERIFSKTNGILPASLSTRW